MDRLVRVLSRPTAKPYRTHALSQSEASSKPFINSNGHLDFSPGDVENPKNWSTRRRWYVTLAAVLLVLNATFASSSPTGSLDGIAETFGVSVEVGGLVTTVFLLGYCFGPLFWAPLSEFYGRRFIFYISFTLYVTFNLLCAFAPNLAALLIGRFLTGTFVSAPLSNVPGVLADIWGPVERGNAMAMFSTITFVGPALGPVISGFLQLKETWRWNFYVLLWLGAASLILMFTIPETLAPIILKRKAERIRKLQIPGYENVKAPVEDTDRTIGSIFRVALTRPWKILIDPIAFMVAIYLSIVYMLLYMLFTIYPIVFQQKRGWDSGVGELPLIGTALGAVIGGVMIWLSSKRDVRRLEKGHVAVPEDRLPVAMLGGILFPITMFWFAWTGEYNSVHWIVPTIAGVFLATAIDLVFVGYLNYLADSYLMFAASAIAANTVCRSAFGAAAPLFTQYMFDALGVGGGGSLIAGVATLLAPVSFIFYKYGGPIRERSKFAPTGQKKDGVKQDVPREQDTRRSGSEGSTVMDVDGDVEKGDGKGVGEVGRKTYIREEHGLDRVARPEHTREKDAGQLDGEGSLDGETDVEKRL